MSNLTEFLLARIAEDEAVARAFDGIPSRAYETDGLAASAEYVTVYASPARILAECEAKRRIVNLHRPEVFEDAPAEAFCTHDQRTSGLWPCPTMRLLALPYADHPSYDPAWEA